MRLARTLGLIPALALAPIAIPPPVGVSELGRPERSGGSTVAYTAFSHSALWTGVRRLLLDRAPACGCRVGAQALSLGLQQPCSVTPMAGGFPRSTASLEAGLRIVGHLVVTLGHFEVEQGDQRELEGSEVEAPRARTR
jgi:hypothetical protein